jgi:iron complex transport system substrate-binding protein
MSALLALLLLSAPDAGSVLHLGPTRSAPALRVVTLAPSLSELVIALGTPERLVGVSRFDEAPALAKLPRVGGFTDVSVETVFSLKPDLVLVQKSPGNQKPVEALARLGVSVLAVPLTSLADVAEATLTVGQALGRVSQAQALVAQLAAARARVQAAARARGAGPRTLFVYGFSPLVVAGPGSFAHELLTDCGAQNLAAPAPTAYPTYSPERAAVQRPELIIDASDVEEGQAAVRALPGFREARWVKLPDKGLLHPGPSLGPALEALVTLLYPAADGGARVAGPDGGAATR